MRVYITLFATLFLASCVPGFDGTATETAADPAAGAVLADCFQSATAVAWHDANANGVKDEGEVPLAGIEFVLEPTVYSRTRSDETGIARISATTPGEECPKLAQVIATDFAGYELTTEKAVDYISEDAQHLFGFRPVDGGQAPVFIETDMYTGLIFTAETTMMQLKWLSSQADNSWMPTVDGVAALEAGLVAFLQESETDTDFWEYLPNYTRQYAGIEEEGRRLIYGNYFCSDMGLDWQKDFVFVEDGGDCFFQVIFDPETNTFLSLSVNGES